MLFVNVKLVHLTGVRVEQGVQRVKVYRVVDVLPIEEEVLIFRVVFFMS